MFRIVLVIVIVLEKSSGSGFGIEKESVGSLQSAVGKGESVCSLQLAMGKGRQGVRDKKSRFPIPTPTANPEEIVGNRGRDRVSGSKRNQYAAFSWQLANGRGRPVCLPELALVTDTDGEP